MVEPTGRLHFPARSLLVRGLMGEVAILSAVGLLAGVLGGMLGVGGSVIMIPAMFWVLGDVNAHGTRMIHQYQAAAMIVNFLLAGPWR